MFDFYQLAALMELDSLSQADMGRLTGLSPQNIGRIRRGQTPDWDTLLKLATALGVPPGDLDTTIPCGPWTQFTSANLAEVARLHSRVARAKSSFALTQGMDIHLQSRPEDLWTFTRAHTARGWDQPSIELAFAKMEQTSPTLEARLANLNSQHVLLAREDRYERILAYQPDWAAQTIDILEQLRGHTVLAIAETFHWAQLDQTVRRIMRQYLDGFLYWDKILVADTTLAFIRPRLGWFCVTYHRPTVEAVLRELQEAASAIRGLIPSDSSYQTLSDAADTVAFRLDHLKKIAIRQKKGPPQLEGAEKHYWARLALPPEN